MISHMTTLTTLLAGGDVEDCRGGGNSSIVGHLEVLSSRLWPHRSCSCCPVVKVLWSGISKSRVAKSVTHCVLF